MVIGVSQFGCTTTCNITVSVTDIRDGNKNKVFICHNGKLHSISVNAVPAHLGNHDGDKLGSCDQSQGIFLTKAVQGDRKKTLKLIKQ